VPPIIPWQQVKGGHVRAISSQCFLSGAEATLSSSRSSLMPTGSRRAVTSAMEGGTARDGIHRRATARVPWAIMRDRLHPDGT
jgi:hypothetical protein